MSLRYRSAGPIIATYTGPVMKFDGGRNYQPMSVAYKLWNQTHPVPVSENPAAAAAFSKALPRPTYPSTYTPFPSSIAFPHELGTP